LPLYREKEEFEYYVDPPTKTVEAVKNARIQAEAFKQSIQPQLDRVCNIYQTGKAHTTEAIIYIQDEDNKFSRLGIVALGGVFGLLATRKGSFLKRMNLAFGTISGVGILCYPEETKTLVKEGAQSIKKGALVAYNFAVGARPAVGHQNGKAFEKMTDMVSDVGQYGFRLLKREPTTEEKAEPASEPIEDKPSEQILEVAEIVPVVEESSPKESQVDLDVVETATEDVKVPVMEETHVAVAEDDSVAKSEEMIQPVETHVAVAEDDSVAKSEEMIQPVEPVETKVEETIEQVEEQLIEGDPGQSVEEDKEMYTTRS